MKRTGLVVGATLVAVVVIGFLHTVPGRLLVVVIIVHVGASGGGRCGGPGRGSRCDGGRLAMAVVDGDRRIGLNRLRHVALRRGDRGVLLRAVLLVVGAAGCAGGLARYRRGGGLR